MALVRLRHRYRAYTCTESLAGQRHRCGLAWVVKGVRGVLGSIPGRTTTFDGVNFKLDRLEREDSEKVLGLSLSVMQ